MSERAKREWFNTAALACGLLLAVALLKSPLQNAYAVGGSWETDGILVNTTESDRDRLVLIDTNKQRLMIYKCDRAGSFRLINARCYKYDLELEDTSKAEEFERKGGATFARVYELFHRKKP